MSYTFTAAHTDHDGEAPALAIERGILEKAGIRLVGKRCQSEDEVIAVTRDADAVLNGMVPMTRRAIGAMNRCKLIARYGVGVDNIDLDAATEAGIVVSHVVDYCIEEVANHAIMFILALAKQLTRLDGGLRQGIWRPPDVVVPPVHGQTLGIVGCGRIGSAVAKKARAFSLTILGYDPYLSPEALKAADIEPAPFDDLLRRSDYISVHAPLTKETQHLIGDRELRLMKPTAFLINTSRGPVVDTEALLSALKERRVAGAGLDVFDPEPLPAQHPLRTLPNVVLTPHTAAMSTTALQLVRQRVAENVVRALKGEWPLAIANPGVKSRARLQVR